MKINTYTSLAAMALFSLTYSARADFRVLDHYGSGTLPSNDDNSTGPIDLNFFAHVFGRWNSQVYINNNGNVTFGGPTELALPRTIAEELHATNSGIIAPFLSDVDTTFSAPVQFGPGYFEGRHAFVVNWANVAAFGQGQAPSKLNSFQLFMVDRSDVAIGDFDLEFNYTKVQWDEGALSPVSAIIGVADHASTLFLLPGSGVEGSFLDTGPSSTSLIHNHLGHAFDGEDVDGRYSLSFRDGSLVISGPTTVSSAVPEPATWGVSGALGLLMFVAIRKRQRAPKALITEA